MSPIVDFTNVKGLEPLPDGKYLGRIVHAEEGLSNAQQPKIDVRWEIIAPEANAGRQIFDTLSFHPDAMFRTKDVLVALGFGADYQGEIDADALIGREGTLSVITEQSDKLDEEGNPYPPRNKVKKVRKSSAFSATGNNDALAGMTLS